MTAHVETMAYAGETPWHGLGIPVDNDISVGDMLEKAGLNWTVSKRPLYFPKVVADGAPSKLRIVPDEFALVRDNDEMVLDTVGPSFKPVQNSDIFSFFKRFVEAGDMHMETAGSLNGGRFIWALARIDTGFNLGNDETRGYLLLSSPHQFGFSLTVALTPVRVVCWNTINYALGRSLDGSNGNTSARFRMVHSRDFNDQVKAEAELALGLAGEQMKEYGHIAELLSSRVAKEADTFDFFRSVLRIEETEDDTEEAAAQAAEEDNRRMRRLKEALATAPGQNLDSSRDTWWGAYNAVTYVVDHEAGRTQDNRLFSAWYGQGSATKRRALELAVEFAGA